MLRPSHEAPATRSLVLRLIPRYLDREAYAVTEAPFEELLQLGFESLVHTDPLPAGAQASGMRVLQCESGLNVLCHLDGTAAMQQCAAIIKQSEAMANPQTKLNIVFVLPEEIDSLTEEVRKLLSRKVKIGTHQDALSATRKSDLIVVPATSTEEAIFTLQAW